MVSFFCKAKPAAPKSGLYLLSQRLFGNSGFEPAKRVEGSSPRVLTLGNIAFSPPPGQPPPTAAAGRVGKGWGVAGSQGSMTRPGLRADTQLLG
ncbi:MAG: hypothetical protein HY774_10015 [Acidobacteria bacterium]|nr:hypothetical protein [Acidobacteriota bacterium]